MIEVYPDKSGEWRWRKKAGNGDVTADSGEGYESRAGAIAAARAEAGGKTYNLTDPDTGEVEGQRTEAPNEQVVLLREDGTVVGELDPAPAAPDSEDTHISVDPIDTEEGAG